MLVCWIHACNQSLCQSHRRTINVDAPCSVVQHIRGSYEALQPVTSALLQAYPQHLKQEYFSWEAFLWVRFRLPTTM